MLQLQQEGQLQQQQCTTTPGKTGVVAIFADVVELIRGELLTEASVAE